MYNVWSFFTNKSRFGTILIATILFLGISSIVSIPKESSPEVEVPIAVVSTVLPGASPEDVEKLVTNVLEEPLKNSLEDVNNITSSSGEGVSSITIEFTAHADLDKVLQDVRDQVDISKTELPSEALDPRVIEIDFASEPVVTFTLSADIPQELLYQIGEETADELETLQGVSSVSVGGIEDREVTVIINRHALAQYGITVSDVSRAIAGANVALPVGSLEINDVEFPVRLAGDIRSTDAIQNLPILAVGGNPIYVRDVARIIDGREEPTTLSRTSLDNEPSIASVSFDVYKSSGAKITQVSKRIQDRLSSLTAENGALEGMHVYVMYDNGELLQQDLSTLTFSGIQTVALVTIVLMLAVGWREALIAAISIPLSFLVAFVALYYSGNTLNFISLFALILSIGIIVDSTIVIVEGINRRLKTLSVETGETNEEREFAKSRAALDVVREFHIPLTAGTMTTVAVFAPLLMVSGIVGEFIKSIPFTIIFVLLASLLVALGFVPLFATKLLRRGSQSTSTIAQRRDVMVGRVESGYRTFLAQFLEKRETGATFFVTLILLFVVAMAFPVIGAVKVVFFEDTNSDYVVVELEMPTGTVLERTDLEVRKVEEVLYTVPEATSFVTSVGRTSSFGNTTGGSSSNGRFANIFITLNEDRDRTSIEIVDDIRTKVQDIKTATIRVDQLSDGPPSLAPVTITLYGDDLVALDQAALVVEHVLSDIPGTTDITSSAKNNSTEFVFTINRAEAVAQGVSIGTIASTLRAALYGEDVSEIKLLGDDIDIVTRLELNDSDTTTTNAFATNETTLDTLAQIPIATQNGLIPLSAFVESRVQQSRATITHDDGERIATVSSRLTQDGNALLITQEFQDRISALQLPEGVRVSVGGESEDIDQSFADMFTALIIGMVSMFAILVLQFNSFRYAMYVLAIVPLSLIGVFTGLMVTGSPLSFPSIMGFIALSGIVVNNAIILVDTIISERRRSEGSKTMNEIIVEASVSRLRPVLLTALTTVIGVVPLLFAASLWVPLAYALMFGLAFSTIITLLLVPYIYSRWPGKLH